MSAMVGLSQSHPRSGVSGGIERAERLTEATRLYRVTGNDKGVCPAEPAAQKASHVFVQVSIKPRKAFKHLAIDGKWLHVYDDHVRFLTKKRVRVDGKQVTGYTAKGLRVEVVA